MATFLIVVFGIIVLAMLAVLAGGIMMLVGAFRESVFWGLAYLFLPLAPFGFIFTHWDRAGAGFLVSAGGFLATVVLLFSLEKVAPAELALVKAEWFKALSETETRPKPSEPLTEKIQAVRDRITKIESDVIQTRPVLNGQFNELAARRKTLAGADAAAIATFNEDAAAYQKLNGERKAMLDDLQVANQELSVLLAGQAKSAKRIVLYTTSTCGACKVAKSYFAQKGINYQEIDVTKSSEGAAEFKRLGGRGVPLILVGDKRMEGFNSQALEAML